MKNTRVVIPLDTENDVLLTCTLLDNDKLACKILAPNSADNLLISNLARIASYKNIAEQQISDENLAIPKKYEPQGQENEVDIDSETKSFNLPIVQKDNEGLFHVYLGNNALAVFDENLSLLEQSVKMLPSSKVFLAQHTEYDPSLEPPGAFTAIKDIQEGKYYQQEQLLHTDVHNHFAGLLDPNTLIALGIKHNVEYNMGLMLLYGIEPSEKNNIALENSFNNLIMSFKEKLLEHGYAESDLTYENMIKEMRRVLLKGTEEFGKNEEQKKIEISAPRDILIKNLAESITIPFIDLIDNPENLKKINMSLRLPINGQAVFTNLEEVYDARTPFTKGNGGKVSADTIQSARETLKKISTDDNLQIEEVLRKLDEMEQDFSNKKFQDFELQEDLMLWVAKQSAQQGVNHIQTSQAVLTKSGGRAEDFLKRIEKALPIIREETNVDIRFLAAIRRSFATQKEFDNAVSVLLNSAKSKYVVGLDIMGEELNETKHFKKVLAQVAEYALAEDPNFVIRVHAGENKSLPENIKQVIDTVKGVAEQHADENGNVRYPQIRIGHGLYGPTPDSKLIQDMRDMGVIVEINATSNIRLNNMDAKEAINKFKELIKMYTDNGIGVVAGTDGGGIYGTNIRQEQTFIQTALGRNIVNWMARTEEKIVKGIAKRDKKRRTEKVDINRYVNYTGNSKDGDNFKENVKTEPAVRDAIKEKIKYGLPTDKMPIVIAGGSFDMRNKEQRELPEFDKSLIDRYVEKVGNEGGYSFVIGCSGTMQEGYLLQAVKAFNENNPDKKIDVTMVAPKTVEQEDNRAINQEEADDIVNIQKLAQAKEITGIIRVELDEQTGIYKGFSDDIFKKMESVVIAFDGDAPIQNLIQVAAKGKKRAEIIVCTDSEALVEKYNSLGRGKIKCFSRNDGMKDVYEAPRDDGMKDGYEDSMDLNIPVSYFKDAINTILEKLGKNRMNLNTKNKNLDGNGRNLE